MKRGASFISSFLLFLMSLALINFLVNPSNQNQNYFDVSTSITSLFGAFTEFFSNPLNYALLLVTFGLAGTGGGSFIATLLPILVSLITAIGLFSGMINSMFPGNDFATSAVRLILIGAIQIGVFMGVMVLFRGISED